MKTSVFDLQTARKLILDKCYRLDAEKVPLEKAGCRILAQNVQAQYNIPMFDKSPLDGFAFHAYDTKNASEGTPVQLAVVEEIAAGGSPTRPLNEGEAVKILTGAPTPEGADAICRFEDVEYVNGYVQIFDRYHPMENIVCKGEDVAAGETIAFKGTRIDSALHGMLASQGIKVVEVYKTPLIGIISQGNELINPGERLMPGKIYNSNRYTLSTALKKEGFGSIFLGSVRDEEEAIADFLKNAVSMYDILIMTGGVSVGTYDYTKSALEKAGAEILVDKIKMKPGSSCCLAILNGIPVFALSGNPSAALTTFHLVTMPGIRKVAGIKDYMPEKITVELDTDFTKKSPNTRILKGKLDLTDGVARMRLNEKQHNGSVSAMKGADVFAVVPAGTDGLKKGSILDAYMI